MRGLIRSLVGVALLLPGVELLAQRAPTPTFAFTHVTVVDVVAGNLLPDRTVVIEGDRIRSMSVSSSTTPPPNARVVDARGKYLIPGLWDMHAHATSPRLARLMLPLLVANGVTGIRDMWGDVANAAQIRQDVANGQRLAPRSVVAGHLLDGPPGLFPPSVFPRSIVVGTPERGRAVVDSLARAGAAFIKVYTLLAPDVYNAIAGEAKRIGIPFAGHVPSQVRAIDASDRGQRSLEHLFGLSEGCSRDEAASMTQDRAGYIAGLNGDTAGVRTARRAWLQNAVSGFDSTQCDALLGRLANNKTWVVPTQVINYRLVFPERIDTLNPLLRFVSSSDRRAWIATMDRTGRDSADRVLIARYWTLREHLIRRMRDLGVPLLAGSDHANPFVVGGFSLHEELELLVRAGLTPLEALRAATIDPARFFAATDSLGSVIAGKLADLVLLDGDPLQDIRNTQRIRGVVLGGRYLDRRALDEMLADTERAARDSPSR